MIFYFIKTGGDYYLIKQQTKENDSFGIVFIGENCADLIMSSAGILAKMGQSPDIIDASMTSELFEIAAGYGGKTKKTVTFRKTDYISCKDIKELKSLLFSKTEEKENKNTEFWIYMNPQSFYGKMADCLEEKLYKRIVIADSFLHTMNPIFHMIKKEKFYADLFLLRGLPGKKITFSYFCKVYQKEFQIFKRIQELPWAEEDLEYRMRLEYEPSQGFIRLSEGYHHAVEEICMTAGSFKKAELRKVFKTFEKNER